MQTTFIPAGQLTPHKYSFRQWVTMTVAMWGFMANLSWRKRVTRMWEIIVYTVNGGPLVWVIAGGIFVGALVWHRVWLRLTYNRGMRATGLDPKGNWTGTPYTDGAGVTHYLSPDEERAHFDAEAEQLFRSEKDKEWRERWR